MFDRHRSDSSQLTYVFGKKEKIRFKVIPRGYSYLGTNEIVHTYLGVFSDGDLGGESVSLEQSRSPNE